jgi:hypothetical protein
LRDAVQRTRAAEQCPFGFDGGLGRSDTEHDTEVTVDQA